MFCGIDWGHIAVKPISIPQESEILRISASFFVEKKLTFPDFPIVVRHSKKTFGECYHQVMKLLTMNTSVLATPLRSRKWRMNKRNRRLTAKHSLTVSCFAMGASHKIHIIYG